MYIPRYIVREWIGRNMNLAVLDLKDYPRLPGGVLTVNKVTNEEIVVWYDCLNEKVMYGSVTGKKIASYQYA